MDLFESQKEHLLKQNAPLADRMRPRTLDEYIGQEHIIGEGRLLRRAIQIDQLSSIIFYGPPGTGKTTLARIIANTTKAKFISINAVLSGIKDIREAIDNAHKTLSLYRKRTILFIDEVHRFNKSQQDALLPHVENGIIILIGATTENPYFEVNKALVSRSRIFQLSVLTEKDLKNVAIQALKDSERGYGNKNVKIADEALDHLVKVANGDARGVLNALQLAVETTDPDESGKVYIDRTIAEESIQKRAVLYDRDGDAHYDTISAFIKSLRGSDPDAALYWMAKMVYAGEDPRFIFRRMVIFACEDIGLADPYALGVVMDAAQAFDYVGLPEGRYHLSHACIYCATAPKSNSNMAFFDALATVSQQTEDDVPDHLRDPSRDKEGLGHGEGYLYPHAYREHWVAQQYLPGSLQGKLFYQPGEIGYEKNIKVRVERYREAQLEAMVDNEDNGLTGGQENGSEQWIQRTLGAKGKLLQMIRDRVMELASPNRSSLILDLHARTGLLAFEAARRITEGGVWAVVHDNKEFDTIAKMASRMDPLARPQLVLSNTADVIEAIKSQAGKSVRFDIITGRNVLRSIDAKAEFLKSISSILQPDGKIVLSETVPSMGQRISDIAGDIFDKETLVRFKEAENHLFNSKDDPLMSWDANSIIDDLEKLDLFTISSSMHIDSSKRRITPAEIDFWFRYSSEGQRLSLGDRLRELFNPKEMQSLQKKLHLKLDNRDFLWKSVVLFICCNNRKQS
ncbi:AAA family ATPase [Chitinispirillales bacterium ANBcel5]|uniref:AAA family ATPase n=1 Tax=Cellulosispirillum alkaliphilum TaxID=3039283 RepID=UPI002A567180|nr:AAA family ATPase [Chitinispirillales bacterium ANBcel5]